MKPVPADIASIHQTFLELADLLAAASDNIAEPPDRDPLQLAEAMSQLSGVLRDLDREDQNDEGSRRDTSTDISTLGEFGLHLLAEMSRSATELGLSETARALENLSLPLAVWCARRGAEIRSLTQVVNALAHFANHTRDPAAMQQLLELSNEVVDAVSPRLCEDTSASQANNPWRMLLLKRADIATHTLRPNLIEPAFDSIVECIPGDAQRFLAEVMEQMEIISYPPQVRALVTRYFETFATPRRKLH